MSTLNAAVVASVCAFLIGSASVVSDLAIGAEVANLHSSVDCAANGNHDGPDAPEGYAPIGVAKINGIRVAVFALQNGAKLDDAAGEGGGSADVYDSAGRLSRRFSFRENLNSPPLVTEDVPIPSGELTGSRCEKNYEHQTILR